MRKLSALFVATIIAYTGWHAAPAHADLIQVYNSYAIISIDGGGRQWYNNSGSGNPAFSTFGPELEVGQNLYLGGQARTQDPMTGVTVTMFWRLRQEVDPGQFTSTVAFGDFSLPFRNTQSGYDRWEQHPVPGQTPGSTSHSVDVLDGIGPGNYQLNIWYNATDGNVTVWDSNGGANFNSGTITVIPEPGTMGLLVIGLFGAYVVRRKRNLLMNR